MQKRGVEKHLFFSCLLAVKNSKSLALPLGELARRSRD